MTMHRRPLGRSRSLAVISAILVSLDRLAAGGTVTAAAMAAGYTTPSAYVVAFKRELGHTPGEHLRP